MNSRAHGTNPRALATRAQREQWAAAEKRWLAQVEAWIDKAFDPAVDVWDAMPTKFKPWQREQADRIWRERLEQR